MSILGPEVSLKSKNPNILETTTWACYFKFLPFWATTDSLFGFIRDYDDAAGAGAGAGVGAGAGATVPHKRKATKKMHIHSIVACVYVVFISIKI